MKHRYMFLLAGVLWLPMSAQSQEADPLAEQVSQQLEDVMRDPLFSRWEVRRSRTATGARESLKAEAWLDSYADQMGRLVEDFFDWVFNRNANANSPTPTGASGSGGSGISIGEVFKFAGWVLLGVVVLFIGWMVWGLIALKKRTATRAMPPDRQALETALDRADALVAESGVWARHAKDLAQEEDLRLAFRAMYLALLSGLHTLGKIRYQTHYTNGWYVRSYRGPGEEATAFARLTDQFDEVWYGEHVPPIEVFTRVTSEVDRLLDRESSALAKNRGEP